MARARARCSKIIAGAHGIDHGETPLDGRPCRFDTPSEAAAAGISMIYQELDLAPQLTVAANMLLGRVPSRWGVIDRRERRRIAEAALARVGATFGVDDTVGSLSVANQQITAIARSLTLDAKVIVMDEPSAALNENELARGIRGDTRDRFARRFHSLVSHRLNDIDAIGDRVTVLRGGRTIATFDVAAVDEPTLIEAVIGQNRSLLERKQRRFALGPGGAERPRRAPGLGRHPRHRGAPRRDRRSVRAQRLRPHDVPQVAVRSTGFHRRCHPGR